MIFAIQLITLGTQPKCIPWYHRSFPSPRFYSKGVTVHDKTDRRCFMSFHITNVKIRTKTEIVFINSIKISSRWITRSTRPCLFVNIVHTLTETFAKHINIDNPLIVPNIFKPELKQPCSYGSAPRIFAFIFNTQITYRRYQCWFFTRNNFSQYFIILRHGSILVGTLSLSLSFAVHKVILCCFLYAEYTLSQKPEWTRSSLVHVLWKPQTSQE